VNVGDGQVQCFLLVPTDQAVRTIRRYAEVGTGPPCPNGYHDASVAGRVVNVRRAADGTLPACAPRRKAGDPPWPKACACGYEFHVGDHRQVTEWLLWKRADQPDVRYTLRPWRLTNRDEWTAPPGAMWDASWMPQGWRGPDGRCLTVRCPNGLDWHIDGVASSGGRWSREGEPPLITVNPSIAIGRPDDPEFYHGWLHGGSLSGHIG
jgi:hypothetical protein